MAYHVKRGDIHPTEHDTATMPLINITIPSTDDHVSELWLFQIFLDCVGYQQYFHFELVAIKYSYVRLDFMHALQSNVEQ